MKLDQFLYEHPVFTYRDFKKWKAKPRRISDLSLHMMLYYYVKKSKLLLLRRGLYAVIHPGFTSKTLKVDSYLIAAKASDDSVLGYHTALELHGVTYSSFEQFTFLTQQKIKPFEIANQRYQPVSFPSILIKNKKNLFGTEIINRQGLDIKITNISRTFVDVLDRIDLSGGLEEVCRSIENIVILNIDMVIKYCLMLENARLAAKVGFFLERRKGVFAVTDKQLKALLAVKPCSPQYLSINLRNDCQYVKKWNLMIPKQLLNKTWEEPNVKF